MFNPVRWFFEVNKKCFRALSKLFPNTKTGIDKYYFDAVRDSLYDGCTVVDVGGGKTWHLASERSRFQNLRLVVIDPSEEQLSYNHDADEKIIFAMGTDERVPLDDNSADIVTSHMVLEHIANNDFTMREVHRILKPGGKFISAMPNKFAVFAIINQMMPNWLARKILFFFLPETKNSCGFRAYYDRTYYPAMQKLLARYGFSDAKFTFTYHQSWYFGFFLPFGIIALLWDFLMYALNCKPLCAYFCFVTHKKS
ncbi:MAG: class I SAM-dependent methyltransferase [Synergistaceae bacterium]|nr:class I SAM-dependent methyltransferase [Synergistaceae bacterium]